MATTTKFSLEKRLASGFPAAAKVAGRLYFISDQGGLFLGVGTAAADYIQIGVGIGASSDPATSKTYYGLLKATSAYADTVAADARAASVPKTGGSTIDLGTDTFYIDGDGEHLFQIDASDHSIYIGNAPGSTVTMSSASEVYLPSASKVLNGSTFETVASQEYVSRQIAALGTAITYVGESTTNPSTNGATVSGHTTWKKGEVVTYGVKEYILVGTTNVAANWRQFGDEGSYALKTVTISGTGYLTGGGTLESNRTIDINQTTKNKIDGALQALSVGTYMTYSKSGTTATLGIKLETQFNLGDTGSGFLAIKSDGPTDGLYVDLGGSGNVDGTISGTNKLLTKSAADGYYAAKSSAITSITFAGTALTVSSNAASITQAAARTALGLGSAAYVATSTFATAAQGTKADSALQSAASGNTTALTVSTNSTTKAVTITPVTGAVADNNGKLTTAAQVKSYVDTAVAGAVIYWESF